MSDFFDESALIVRMNAGSLILNDHVLRIGEIPGGHRLTVSKSGQPDQIMDVMDGESVQADLAAQVANGLTMPRVFLTSADLLSLQSKQDGEVSGVGVEIRANGKVFRCWARMKVQGSSSQYYPCKNYTITLWADAACAAKLPVDLGWGPRTQYCLKCNWVDSTYTRNVAGARIACEMAKSRPDSAFKRHLEEAPRMGLTDGFPAIVYVNGLLHNLYTLNIPKGDWMLAMDGNNPDHIALSGECKGDDPDNIAQCCFRMPWDGIDGEAWNVEVGSLTPEILAGFNEMSAFVLNADRETFRANANRYLDLDSLMDYFCFAYLTNHADGLAKNMLMLSYDGGRTWGAGLYDLDSIFGATWDGGYYGGSAWYSSNNACPSNYQIPDSRLWEQLVKCFPDELRARYDQLRGGALSLGSIVSHVESLFDAISDRALAEARAKWPAIPAAEENTMARFREWMHRRAQICDVHFPFDWGEIEISGDALILRTGVAVRQDGGVLALETEWIDKEV